jgi:hypothetical protein
VGWLEALGWAHLAAGVLYLASLILHQRVFRGTLPTVVAAVRPAARRGRGRRLPQSRKRASVGQ